MMVSLPKAEKLDGREGGHHVKIQKKAFIAAISFAVLLLAGSGVYRVFFGPYHAYSVMDTLPEGVKLIEDIPSPNGEFTFKGYRLEDGGATIPFRVVGEVTFNRTKRNPEEFITGIEKVSSRLNGLTMKP